MNFYIDDDSVKKELVVRLRSVGHRPTIPIEVGLSGAADPRHFVYAIHNDLVLLTRNYEHFMQLHELVQAARGQHPGIFFIRGDQDTKRDMKSGKIVAAIANLQKSGVPLVNQVYILNHWR